MVLIHITIKQITLYVFIARNKTYLGYNYTTHSIKCYRQLNKGKREKYEEEKDEDEGDGNEDENDKEEEEKMKGKRKNIKTSKSNMRETNKEEATGD